MPGKNKKIQKLKRRIRRLEKELRAIQVPTNGVSPLAPPGGFPLLPVIKGVDFSAVSAGVRYRDRTDVMLARIDPGCTVAGAFTRSTTRSAAVVDCEAKLAELSGTVADGGLALLANSGNANAFTGRDGAIAVSGLAAEVGRRLGIRPGSVFSASTGVIGEKLPVTAIRGAIDSLVEGLDPMRAEDAAKAIMTTDTFPKGSGTVVALDEVEVAVSGIAKGSGMIAPDMATMLAFVFTDAAVQQDVLQEMVSRVCRQSLNCVTVDGDTSTSDTLLVFASAASGARVIDSIDSPSCALLEAGLESVMTDLTKQIARDGEGATKFVEVQVTGAVSDDDAGKVARSVANSPLVKTAVHGEDPNWGRVVMAVGKSGARADRDLLSIRFGGLQVAEGGEVSAFHSEIEAAAYMKNSELVIAVDLGLGRGSAKIWTCDFSKGYVAVNADYRS